jgi:ligand-binding sensor domain-containing protein
MKTKLLFLFIFSTTFLLAQNLDIQNFTNGEDINSVAIEEDTMWISTTGGLVKYNQISGESTFFNRSNSGIPLNRIGSIQIDSEGTKWIASNTGLIEFDGTNWTLHNPPNKKLNVTGFQKDPNTGNFIIQHRSSWVNQLWEFDGTNWTEFEYEHLFGGEISWFTFTPDSIMWASRFEQDSNYIFYKYNGDTSIQTNFYLYDYCDIPCSIDSYSFDPSGQIWFLLSNRVLLNPVGDSWETEEFDASWLYDGFLYVNESEIWIRDKYGDFFSRPISGTEWAKIGDIWESTDPPLKPFIIQQNGSLIQPTSNGLFVFDTSSFELIQKIPTSSSKINSNLTTHLAITNDQTVWAVHGEYDWLHTQSGESLSRFSNHEWATINPPGDYNIRDIKSDADGNLWVLTGGDLAKRENNDWIIYDSIPTPWHVLFDLGINPNSQEIWVTGIGKIARKDGGDFEIMDVPPQFSDYPVDHIEIDNDGNIWIAAFTSECVARFSNDEWTIFDTTDMNLPKFVSYSHELAVAPNGNVWVLTDYGITFFDGNDWKSFTYDNMNSTLPHHAFAIAFDGNDKTWIGYFKNHSDVKYYTHFGLTKIEGDTWTTYSYEDSRLPFSYITSLAVDSFHNVWIGTELEGVAVFNENDIILDVHDSKFTTQIQPIKIEIMPNPFSDEAILKYELKNSSEVNVIVTSAQGEVVLNKNLGQKIGGNYEHILKREDLPDGIYFVSLITKNDIQTFKIVLSN